MGILDIIKQREKEQAGNKENMTLVNVDARNSMKNWKERLERDGRTDNVKEAEKYFEKVSECYDSQVLIELAEIYAEGCLIPQNKEKACECAIHAVEVSTNKERDKYILEIVFKEMLVERTLGDCLLILKDSMDVQARDYINLVEENYRKLQRDEVYAKQESYYGKIVYDGKLPWDKMVLDFTYGNDVIKPSYMGTLYCLLRFFSKEVSLTRLVSFPDRVSSTVMQEYNQAYEVYKKGADFREAVKLMEIPARKGHLEAIENMKQIAIILDKPSLRELWVEVANKVSTPVRRSKKVYNMIMQAANGDMNNLGDLISALEEKNEYGLKNFEPPVQYDKELADALRIWWLYFCETEANKGDGVAIKMLIDCYKYSIHNDRVAEYWEKCAIDMGYVPVISNLVRDYIVSRSYGKPVPFNEVTYLKYVDMKERAGYSDTDSDRKVLKTFAERERLQAQIRENNLAKEYENEMAEYRKKLDNREVFWNTLLYSEPLTNEERGYAAYAIRDADGMQDAIHDYIRRNIKEKDYLNKLKRRDGNE